MILGALVDLGLPLEHLQRELAKLPLEPFDIVAEPVERQGLHGTNLRVLVGHPDPKHSEHLAHDPTRREGHTHEDHTHAHGHHHPGAHGHAPGRGFREIRELIEGSSLDSWVTEKSVAIFRKLAEAEASVHQSSLDEVHFHEVGAVDAIVDIVGACVGFRYFGVERFFSTPLQLGGGTVTFSHGSWPVPAPATVELVKGFPSRLGAAEAELTTPTGAAIITTLAERRRPETFFIEASGYGAGDREFPDIPNLLRLMLGKVGYSEGPAEEEIFLLEASLDDMDGETCGHFLEVALRSGALDVFFTPLCMKKNRPGFLLSVLCHPNDRTRMAELIFRETTTLGVRWTGWRRWVLDREIRPVDTELGAVRVKIGRLHGRAVNVAPEYEDLKALAERHGLPFKVVARRVLKEIANLSDE